jgi:hypothetical protein
VDTGEGVFLQWPEACGSVPLFFGARDAPDSVAVWNARAEQVGCRFTLRQRNAVGAKRARATLSVIGRTGEVRAFYRELRAYAVKKFGSGVGFPPAGRIPVREIRDGKVVQHEENVPGNKLTDAPLLPEGDTFEQLSDASDAEVECLSVEQRTASVSTAVVQEFQKGPGHAAALASVPELLGDPMPGGPSPTTDLLRELLHGAMSQLAVLH